MAEGGILMDVTEYVESFEDRFVGRRAGSTLLQGQHLVPAQGPAPQLLFYNNDIFEQYGIDPAEMSTFEGYVEVGRKLKEASNGEVFLSYIDFGAYTWRYWGCAAAPQAEARIWDDEGNVVIDTDPGTQLALGTLSRSIAKGCSTARPCSSRCSTTPRAKARSPYYIGAFWDEFLPERAGHGRQVACDVRPCSKMSASAAPVVGMQCLIDKPNPVYADLYKLIWEDYHFNAAAARSGPTRWWSRNPYSTPLPQRWKMSSGKSGTLLRRPVLPRDGGQGAGRTSQNLRVTEKDAEADQIISAEIEKWVAGSQTMDEAIANMGQQLRPNRSSPTE